MAYAIKLLNCNAGCKSCYETKLRKTFKEKYNIKAMVESLKIGMESNKDWNTPNIHGGEPLLIKLGDFELLLKTVYEKYSRTGIQTNLLKLKRGHIKLFKKYKTHVGISMDGDTKELHLCYLY